MTILRKLISTLILISSSFATATTTIRFAAIDGPNCLNAAMVSVGLSKSERYASNGEMQTMLKSPLCRRLTNAEVRKVNDIGLIFDNGPYATPGIISHAFVQVSPDKVFEKHGYSQSDPYQVVDLQSVFKDYDFDQNPACRQNQFDRKACRMGTDFYRCDNLENFIAAHKSKIKMYTLGFFRQLEKIEQKLQDDIAAGDFSKNKTIEIARDLQVLASKMVDVDETNVVEENLIYNIIANRFVSIAGQLNAVGFSDLRNVVWHWETQDKNIRHIFEAILKLEIQDDLDNVYAKAREKFAAIYGPIVKAERKVELRLILNKEEASTPPGVSLYSDYVHVEMGSDFHRDPAMTPDAFLGMLCHEIGHVLGGEPYSENTMKPSAQWVSNVPSSTEGQSDYFSSLACMKKVFADTTQNTHADFAVTPRVKSLCVRQYSNILDQNICQRSAQSGFEIMHFIISVYERFGSNSDQLKLNMDTPEGPGLSVGRLYPSVQCRFDTILAGALNHHRPACWFVAK